jgi:glycosyltransferase involved in cell wall biosynthesis
MAPLLRVAIDGRRLQERPLGGVGRWLSNLLPYLATEADVVVLTNSSRPQVSTPVPQAPLRLPAGLPEVVWVQVSAAWWLRKFSGIFHGTFNALPAWWRGRGVVTVHDLATVYHPEDFDGARIKREVWTAQVRRSIHQAAAIHTVSTHVRDAIVSDCGVDPARIFVAPPAVDPVFCPGKEEAGRELAARLGVNGPFVVAIGGARRRGLDVAVQAWGQARRAGASESMIVVGPDVLPPKDGLVQAGCLPDEQWASLLAAATALCYPTRYEGFGMPALEAMASGTPVVCPRTGPLPDVLGDAAKWCDDATLTGVSAGLISLLSDEKGQAELTAAGLARAAASTSWAEAARTIMQAYQMAAAS